MSFIRVVDAIEKWIIPKEWIVESVWTPGEIYSNRGKINAWCWFIDYAWLIIDDTKVQCGALIEWWICSLLSLDSRQPIPCKVQSILNEFNNKKEVA